MATKKKTTPKKTAKKATKKAAAPVAAKKGAKTRAQSPHTASKATKTSLPTTENKLGRKAAIVALISRPTGATLPEIMKAIGWQAHSVRGAIATLKTKGGMVITSQRTSEGERVYTAEVAA